MSSARKIAFLDRDGTLIETRVVDGLPHPVHGAHHTAIIDGVAEGCARLRAAGFALVMVTNQPDVARGTVDRAMVDAANAEIVDALELDLSLVCYHDDADHCLCRKPRPGMLFDGADRLGVELDRSSVMIGDRWRDVDAGRAAGVTSVLIERGYRELVPHRPNAVVTSFEAAVGWILAADRSAVAT